VGYSPWVAKSRTGLNDFTLDTRDIHNETDIHTEKEKHALRDTHTERDIHTE